MHGSASVPPTLGPSGVHPALMLMGFLIGMPDDAHTVDAREAARRRVRRVTGVVVAASVAVAGSISAYVAGAGTHKSTGGTTTSSSRTTTATEVPVPTTPAAPSLDPTGPSSQAPAQSAPVHAPAQSASPPVAVSGGS